MILLGFAPAASSGLAWDVESEFYRLERPWGENEVRRLFLLTDRPSEVLLHRDIVTKENHGESRVFDDSSACGVADDQPPCCTQVCSGLQHCTALNDRRIEDKYFPTLPFIQVSLTA